MTNELLVIYRACGNELLPQNFKNGRPSWFNKLNCYNSFYQCFVRKADIHVVWDGDKNNGFYHYIKGFLHQTIHEIDARNNQKSLEYCYDLIGASSAKYVNLAEDDYQWLAGSYEFMIDALKLGYDPLTLYDHPDRYIQDGRGWYVGATDETLGRDYHGLTNRGFVRTIESTTCSFACSKKFFDTTKDALYHFNEIGHGAPEDRKYWRYINNNYPFRLWCANPGLICHLQLPLTPHRDWEDKQKNEN